MEELDEFGIPIKKTNVKKPIVDEFGIPVKKKDGTNVPSSSSTTQKPTSDSAMQSKDGSLVTPKKYRLPNESDFEQMQQQGIVAPPSEIEKRKSVDVKIDRNELLGRQTPIERVENLPISKTENKKATQEEIANRNTPSIIPIEKEKEAETIYDFKESDKQGLKSKIDEKIEKEDLLLDKPFASYSSYDKPPIYDPALQTYVTQEKDNFISNNFGEDKLSELGIDASDFDGFINKNGYKQDYLNREEKGLFENDNSRQNPTLAKEANKFRMLNLYIKEKNRRENLKRDLEANKENLERPFSEKIKPSQVTVFEPAKIESYVEAELPNLYKKLKERDTENQKILEAHNKGEANLLYGTKQTFKSGWNGFIDRLNNSFATVYDKIGLDTSAEEVRLLHEENQMLRPDTRDVGYVSGKKANLDGVNYIVDESGQIYDADKKIRVTDLMFKETYDKINELAQKGERDYIYSPQGTAIQAGGVLGDILVQILATKGAGNVVSGISGASKIGLGVDLSKIPMSRNLSNAIIAQSALGYSSGMEETLKTAKEEGLSDAEAQMLASDASQRMALLYAITAPISPQTKATQALFGSESKNLIKKAVLAYKEGGKKGFVETLKGGLPKLAKNTGEFTEEGVKELFQENIQQTGENYVINAETNRQAGKQILKESISGDEFINTSILSFLTSGLASQAKMPTFFSNAKVDQLKTLGQISQDIPKFESNLKEMVSSKIITPEIAEKLKADVKAYSNNQNKIPKDASSEVAMDLMRKLEEINQLEVQKKTLDKSFHKGIDEKIEAKREEANKLYQNQQDAKTEIPIAETEQKVEVQEQTEEQKVEQPQSTASQQNEDGSYGFNLPKADSKKAEIPYWHREEHEGRINQYQEWIDEYKEDLKKEESKGMLSSWLSDSKTEKKWIKKTIKQYEDKIKLLQENPVEFYRSELKRVKESHEERVEDDPEFKQRLIDEYGSADFEVTSGNLIDRFNNTIFDYEAVQKTANKNAKQTKQPTEVQEISKEAITPEVEQKPLEDEAISEPNINADGNVSVGDNILESNGIAKQQNNQAGDVQNANDGNAGKREVELDINEVEGFLNEEFGDKKPVKTPKQEVKKEEVPNSVGVAEVKKESTPVKQAKGFASMAVDNLTTSLKDFQGRAKEYSEQTYNRIVDEAKQGKLNISSIPPIQIWKNPQTGKFVILAGHSRTKAFSDLASGKVEFSDKYKKSDFENINSQIVEAETLEEAQKIAQESNQGAVQTVVDNAKYVRESLLPTFKNFNQAKTKLKSLYGSAWARIYAYANLNPKGKAMQMLKQFQDSNESDSDDKSKKIAEWTGKSRSDFENLTDAHENEIFDYLLKNDKIKTYSELSELLNRRVNGLEEFNTNEPLNFEQKIGRGSNEVEIVKQIQDLKNRDIQIKKQIKELQSFGKNINESQRKQIKELTAESIKINTVDIPNAQVKQKQARAADAEQFDIFSQINEQIENGNITPEQVDKFVNDDRKAEEIEPIVKAIESKAKSENKVELEEAVAEVEEFLATEENKKSEYKFSNSPSLKNAQAVDSSVLPITLKATENILKNEGNWDKAIIGDVKNLGNGWFEVGKTVKGESVLYSPTTDKAATIVDSENKGGRNAVYVNDFVKNNPTISEKQQRKDLANAEIDKIAQKVKDLLPGIKDPNVKTQGFSQDQLIDLVATAVKNLIAAGIEIDEAIKQVVSSLKERFGDLGFEIDPNKVKSILNPPANDFVRKEGKKSVATRLATGNSSVIKKAIADFSLDYEIENQDLAKKKAEQYVDKVGIDEAFKAAQNEDIKGAEKAFVYGKIISDLQKEIAENQDDIERVMSIQEGILKDAVKALDEKGREYGRFISAINKIINSSDGMYNLSYQINKYKNNNEGKIPKDILEKFEIANAKIKELEAKLLEAEKRREEESSVRSIEEIIESISRKNKIDRSKGISSQTKAKELADKLRSYKIAKSGTTKASLGVDVIYDAAIEIIALAIENAPQTKETIGQAIKKGIEYIRSQNLSQDEENQAVAQVFNAFEQAETTQRGIRIDKDGKLRIPHSLIREKVINGIDNIDDLVASVKADVEEMFPDEQFTDRQIRDAITDYGKTTNPTKDEVETEISIMKSLGKLASGLEDAYSGKRPLRSGLQRRIPTDKERLLNRRLMELMRDLPMDDADLQKSWKTALDAIKTRLQNEIRDLDSQIENREKRKPEKKVIEYDQDANNLKAERDAKREILDELVGKPELTEEQKIEKTVLLLEKTINENQEKIDRREIQYKVKPTPVTSEKIEELRAINKSLLSEIEQMRQEAGLVEMKRLEMAKKSALKRIEELKTRLRDGDFSKKERKPLKSDAELAKIRNEMVLLKEVYDKEAYKLELKNQSVTKKIGNLLLDILNIPKILSFTIDMSFVGIQGGIQAFRIARTNPKLFGRLFLNTLKAMANPKIEARYAAEIKSDPDYELMRVSKLAITEANYKATAGEEIFQHNILNATFDAIGNKLEEKGRTKEANIVKNYANITKPFERGQTYFLNQMRVHRFKEGVAILKKQGKNEVDDVNEYRKVAAAVNTLTGRANTEQQTLAALRSLNGTVFSSFANWLSVINQLNPYWYATLTPTARKMAIVDLMTFIVGAGGLLSLTLLANDSDDEEEKKWTIETDPRSSDFMLAKKGNLRIDPWQTKKSHVVFIARVLPVIGGVKNQDGEIVEFGVDYNDKNRLELTWNYTSNKFSPGVSALIDYVAMTEAKEYGDRKFRENKYGEDFNASKMFIPLYLQSIKEVAKEQPELTGKAINVLNYFGLINIGIYGEKKGVKNMPDVDENGNPTVDPKNSGIERPSRPSRPTGF